MNFRNVARCALLALALMLVGVACSDQGASGDISPFAEAPFPQLSRSDFAFDPDVGIVLSKAHLLVAFTEGATEEEARMAISDIHGVVVGALGEARIALVQLFPGISPAQRREAISGLQAHTGVLAVSEDLLLSTTNVPKDAELENWNWGPSVGGGNWSPKAMGMPIAWNLKPLMDSVATSRRVRVGVVDGGFQEHPDLLPDILRLVDGSFGNASPSDDIDSHGTSVAGVIGARWDGLFTDGISPFVDIVAMVNQLPDVQGPQAAALSYAIGLSQIWQALNREGTRPRLVNISLGMNYYLNCEPSYREEFCNSDGCSERVYGGRCDPRQNASPDEVLKWGTPIADSNCNGELVRRTLRGAGDIFGRLVNGAQSSGPVLFVVSAGNDSGSTDPLGRDYCADPGNVPKKMGLFPAVLSSPMAWAGLNEENPNPNILVVEAVRKHSNSMLGTVERASYSNINGHILAPGDHGFSIGGSGDQGMVVPFGGTSAAAPYVTGGAAWLLSLNPNLSNAQLRELLLVDGAPIEGTATRHRLHILSSTEAMEVLLPRGTGFASGAHLLADMDDGTPDGFTRFARDPTTGQILIDPVSNEPVPFQGRRDFMTSPTPWVDMADFRYFRDSFLLRENLLTCSAETPACDLNGDGQYEPVASPDSEPYPRNNLFQPMEGRATLTQNLSKLMAQWDGDQLQGWRDTDLPDLLKSADILVMAEAFLSHAGASDLRVTLTGNIPAGNQDPHNSLATTDLVVNAAPAVFTTPYTQDAQIHIQVGSRVFTANLENLGPGEDKLAFLNPCAWDDPTIGILDTYTPGTCVPSGGGGGSTGCGATEVEIGTLQINSGSGTEAVTGDPVSPINENYTLCIPAASGTGQSSSYNTATGFTEIRLSAFVKVNGAPPTFGSDSEYRIAITTHVQGSGPSAYMWDGDLPDEGFSFEFFRPLGSDIACCGETPGTPPECASPSYQCSNMFRDFANIISGSTTVTSVGAVGDYVTGSFSGQGLLTQSALVGQNFPNAQIQGTFRVKRIQDYVPSP